MRIKSVYASVWDCAAWLPAPSSAALSHPWGVGLRSKDYSLTLTLTVSQSRVLERWEKTIFKLFTSLTYMIFPCFIPLGWSDLSLFIVVWSIFSVLLSCILCVKSAIKNTVLLSNLLTYLHWDLLLFLPHWGLLLPLPLPQHSLYSCQQLHWPTGIEKKLESSLVSVFRRTVDCSCNITSD